VYSTTTGKPSSSLLGSTSLFANAPTRLGLVRDTYELYVELSTCYKPENVSVSTQDDLIIISGKYEETHPEFGYQSKEFTHKYTLPKNVDKGKMSCVFKERGYLKIEAPFIRPEEPNSRQIPIKVLASESHPQSCSSPQPIITTTSKTASSSSITTNGSVSHV